MSNKVLNILIVEDELLIAEMLKEMLLELNYNVAAIAKNYTEMVTAFNKNTDINFAILDINLSDEKTGLHVAKYINEVCYIPFIFLTSYATKDVIKEAIDLKPQSYLLKPFTKTDLFVTLELVKSKTTETEKTIIIKDGSLTIKIKHVDIMWIKSDNIYLEIQTVERKHLIRNSLDKFLDELSADCFFRVHRSYAVNVKYIKAVNGQYILIENEKIPMSRNLRDELLVKFGVKFI